MGAEMDAKDGEAFYSKLLNDMVTFVAVLEVDGTVIFANNTPLDLAGIKLEDVKGKKLYDAYWWNYSKEAQESIKADVKRCARGEHFTHEIQSKIADGALIWTEFGMHPVFDEKGDLSYLVAEGRDINDKKQALEDAKQKVAYLDNTPTYIVVTDLEGKLVFANPPTFSAFDFKLEDVVGREFDGMEWWDYSEDVQRRMREVIADAAKGIPSAFEVEGHVGDEIVPIKYTCDPLHDEEGEIYASLHTGTRIDELRAALDDAKE